MASLPSLLARGHLRSRRLPRLSLSYQLQRSSTPAGQRYTSNLSNVAVQDLPLQRGSQGSTSYQSREFESYNGLKRESSDTVDPEDGVKKETSDGMEEVFKVSFT